MAHLHTGQKAAFFFICFFGAGTKAKGKYVVLWGLVVKPPWMSSPAWLAALGVGGETPDMTPLVSLLPWQLLVKPQSGHHDAFSGEPFFKPSQIFLHNFGRAFFYPSQIFLHNLGVMA